jgi:hypothetical protein
MSDIFGVIIIIGLVSVIEFIASSFKTLLEGAKLSPRPEPTVTPRDVRDNGKRK